MHRARAHPALSRAMQARAQVERREQSSAVLRFFFSYGKQVETECVYCVGVYTCIDCGFV